MTGRGHFFQCGPTLAIDSIITIHAYMAHAWHTHGTRMAYRWGANFAIDSIITRRKPGSDADDVSSFQLLAERRDDFRYGIPGGGKALSPNPNPNPNPNPDPDPDPNSNPNPNPSREVARLLP